MPPVPRTQGCDDPDAPALARAAVVGGVAGFAIVAAFISLLVGSSGGGLDGIGAGLFVGAFGGVGFGAMVGASAVANRLEVERRQAAAVRPADHRDQR